MIFPEFPRFQRLAQQFGMVPVFSEILADVDTPVSALMRFGSKPCLFLLESVEGGEKWGRYSFLGFDPRVLFRVRGAEISMEEQGGVRRMAHGGDPLKFLRDLLYRHRPAPVEGLPRFYGGAVGFLGYDMVRHFERLPMRAKDDLGTDEAVFLLTDTLLIFDNTRHTIKVVTIAVADGREEPRTLYESATKRIEAAIASLQAPLGGRGSFEGPFAPLSIEPNVSPHEFRAMVAKARDYILSGDAIQVVLSQRFEMEGSVDPVDLYRALRYINPSPYLFFLKIPGLALIGSSPEVMVRLEEGVVELRPIAGTRRRGRNEQEDRALSHELLQDPKERAEHVMLVDLGRNDLGRIARTGSVQVNQLMVVERYSHVMHLVSQIQAQLSEGKDAFDVLKATFPAGTLTGAPKVRAMEIIEELEPSRRGPYGGAVGYFSYSGNMDLCITIRTILVKDGRLYIQAGAGVVADSDPEAEYQESVNKAQGMIQAVVMAASGLALPRAGR